MFYMEKTVKDLIVGKEYIFIEANPQKSKNLNIVRAILTSCDRNEKRGWFPAFETNDSLKGEFFFIQEIMKENEPLNSILFIWVNSNYDKPEAKKKLEELFGTMRNPIGYIVCDAESVEETIKQYSDFLNDSIIKYQNKINEMIEDLNNKKIIYPQQIEWLHNSLSQ